MVVITIAYAVHTQLMVVKIQLHQVRTTYASTPLPGRTPANVPKTSWRLGNPSPSHVFMFKTSEKV